MSRRNRVELTESEISDFQSFSSRTVPGQTRVIEFTNEKLFESAFQIFADFKRHQTLSDITLEAYCHDSNDRNGVPIEIKAHKIVLAGVSPYFKAMFTLPLAEATMDRINLRDVDGKTLKLIVDYIYSGRIEINEENVQNLLSTASILQIQCLKDACAKFLLDQLDVTNCLGIYSFASMHHCKQLETTSKAFSRRYFSDVMDHEEMLTLDIDQFIELISDDKIAVKNEEVVFRAIKKWIDYSPADRDQHIVQLLRIVRLPQIDKDCLLREVREDPLVKNNTECLNLILDSFKQDFVEDRGLHEVLHDHWLRPRQPYVNSQLIMIIGGQAPKASENVDIFDPNTCTWTDCKSIPIKKCRSGAAVIDNKVYIVGGFNGTARTRSVEIFDVALNRWTIGPQMETRRGTLGVATIDNAIYAVGGFDGNIGLSSAEVMDLREGRWFNIKSMTTRRSSVGVYAHNGFIYAVGGYDGIARQCTRTVECYDPRMNRWLDGPPLNQMRSGAGVTVHQGHLICAGGHDGPKVCSSVEILKDGRWEFLPNMMLMRRNAGIVTANGSVFAIGGDDGRDNLDSIEMLDWNKTLDGFQWTMLESSIPTARSYAAVAVLSPRP